MGIGLFSNILKIYLYFSVYFFLLPVSNLQDTEVLANNLIRCFFSRELNIYIYIYIYLDWTGVGPN